MPRDPEMPRKVNNELNPEERGKILGAIEAGVSQQQAAQAARCF